MVRSFRVIQYDTSNFHSIKPETKELELLLQKNSLPKMNMMMFGVLRVLSKREKFDFEKHSIVDLIKEFSGQEGKYPEQVRNIKNYLQELDIDEIVTPCRRVTDFIEEDLVATNAGFLGELLPRIQRLDNEHKKITNTPNKSTTGIMKFMVLILLVAMVGVGGYLAYEEGVFDGITDLGGSFGAISEGFSSIPSPTQGFQVPSSVPGSSSGGIDYSDSALQARYTPEQLKNAINTGEVNYNKLSSNMKSLVDAIETP